MGVMMKCGCVSSAVCSGRGGVKFDPPIPSCVVHDCFEAADSLPDLTGRMADCAYLPKGHATKPSSLELAFFEFRGAGSREATELCKCGLSKKPHDENGGKIPAHKYPIVRNGCAGFDPKGAQERDRYYCGCHGWD